ncbi:MAG: hypothetical protein HZA59_01510 [Hydrogenophilales bacterium]|nr:hypothetical protein [Hydrogenophilales bacterium]
MTQFLKKLRVWLAKLAFWRKRAADAAPPPEAEPAPAAAVDSAEPAPEQPAAKPGWLARLKGLFTFRRKVEAVADTAEEAEAEPVAEKKPRPKASEEAEVSEPKPGFFARLKQRLSFRRKPAETEAEPDAEAAAEKKPKSKDSEEAEVTEPKPGFFARLKGWLSFRRKPAETEADDKTLVIDKAKTGSETTAAEGEEEAPQPGRLKRLMIRLRSKMVWIPALSLAVVGLVSWVVVVMLHATHEKERLQAELKAAKKMLEQKQVAAVVRPAPPPPQPAAPAKPEKKIDPAFEIVGHIPAPQPEEESGINASDCVVKDKASVSENLKRCIEGFNSAAAGSANKSKGN